MFGKVEKQPAAANDAEFQASAPPDAEGDNILQNAKAMNENGGGSGCSSSGANADMFKMLARVEKENAKFGHTPAPPDADLENFTLATPTQAQMDDIEAYVHGLAKDNMQPELALEKIEAFVEGIAQQNRTPAHEGGNEEEVEQPSR